MPDIWLEKYRPIKFEVGVNSGTVGTNQPVVSPLFLFEKLAKAVKDVVGNTGAVAILKSHAAAGSKGEGCWLEEKMQGKRFVFIVYTFAFLYKIHTQSSYPCKL